ncbi:carboxymuconolactone decarboxylase family protein [Bradyrhizobium sp. BWA-3-5]|uniref:carboxymuconolactone decarboxylase family protein n=1 Tax=Bradyrhizobium sp. BWA-3-5 TaxID=3080013 RepID=UPI00293EBA87|nr:carboxymuconolactone decarboxylase family protein [Bradyrhizobium sp. BWA-3-5]WOH64077.1 carboxymuconolactone decarboxylase family protein [Bradyrhizobium sp. BWA-3-5]WOH64203.1 carboxymuconolactone decarboxylase family protein [Bradyrhizobium sp. BWA-3-5]WOH70126.1 carboxymuconolactone decarboxylase family protein [Bradyrhizobium sp. BWA-3-5]
MSIEQLKDQIPDFAKDVRLNLASIVADETFSPQSKYGLLLATAIATCTPAVIAAMESAAAEVLSPAALTASKSAASVMAMNNVYYRFVHLASNPEYKSMPARLRMNVIADPGVDKADFELWSLAVSAINGCGACMDAHEKALQEAGVGSAAIQTAVRFAAIVQSVAVAIS